MDIKIEKFEGPLNLLLQLIEGQELDITQISLAKIADDYIQYIKKTENIEPEEIADFLVIAAKLLLIKSRALMPYLFPDEEEEAREFENQLKMYQEFLEAAKALEEMVLSKSWSHFREFNRQLFARLPEFNPPKKIKSEILESIIAEMAEKIKRQKASKLEERTLEKNINLEDRISDIVKELTRKTKFRFSSLMKSGASKTEVVVSFLAMLELLKQGAINVDQSEMFGDIDIEKFIDNN